MFLVRVKKNTSTAQFLDAQELHYRTTWKANVCIFMQITGGEFLFQRRRKVLFGAAE